MRSRLSPQRSGVPQHPLPLTPRRRRERRPFTHLLSTQRSPRRTAGERRRNPARCPLPESAPLLPHPLQWVPPTLKGHPFAGYPAETQARPRSPLAPSYAARRPLPERRRQQGLRPARALMAAYPARSQPTGSSVTRRGSASSLQQARGPHVRREPSCRTRGRDRHNSSSSPAATSSSRVCRPSGKRRCRAARSAGAAPSRGRPSGAANRRLAQLDGRRHSANGKGRDRRKDCQAVCVSCPF